VWEKGRTDSGEVENRRLLKGRDRKLKRRGLPRFVFLGCFQSRKNSNRGELGASAGVKGGRSKVRTEERKNLLNFMRNGILKTKKRMLAKKEIKARMVEWGSVVEEKKLKRKGEDFGLCRPVQEERGYMVEKRKKACNR